MMTAAAIAAGTQHVDAGPEQALFEVQVQLGIAQHFYDVSRDGQRFLLLVPQAASAASPLTLLVNWPVLAGGTR